MMIHPGALRIRGKGEGLLTTHDLVVEVMQENGEWLGLKTVTRLSMDIHAGQPHVVEANLSLFVHELDLTDVEMGRMQWKHLPAWWQGPWTWVRIKRMACRLVQR